MVLLKREKVREGSYSSFSVLYKQTGHRRIMGKCIFWVGEVAQWVKRLLSKPEALNLIPRSHEKAESNVHL